MKSLFSLFIVASFIVLLGVGCADATSTDSSSVSSLSSPAETSVQDVKEEAATQNDFTPASGSAKGPGEFGPWVNRVVLATSTDGKTFTSTGTVIGDQFDVPDLLTLPDGDVALYAIAWTAGSRANQLVVALSDDQGDSWTYKYVVINGLSVPGRGPSPADPDVVLLSDGTVRLYFTFDAKTHYAESQDGITFTYKGVAFSGDGKPVLDPSVIQIGNTWHLYAGGPGKNWHATSTDGKSFTGSANLMVTASDGKEVMISNALALEGGTRFWGFSNQGEDIYSFTTTDGSTFAAEGVALSFTGSAKGEDLHVKDSSVIRLPDGTYLMAYVTHIPE